MRTLLATALSAKINSVIFLFKCLPELTSQFYNYVLRTSLKGASKSAVWIVPAWQSTTSPRKGVATIQA